jgi:hypothetical protein
MRASTHARASSISDVYVSIAASRVRLGATRSARGRESDAQLCGCENEKKK